jgi:hypothetical protein
MDRRVGFMVKTYLVLLIAVVLVLGNEGAVEAQDSPDVRVVVNMVQLNVAVTDKNGKYITGLSPKDFVILEDGIVETPATFAEGNGPAHNLAGVPDQASSGASTI